MLNTAVKPSLTIKRRFNATPDKVYQAWTDPKKVMIWWGPGSADKVLFANMDVRVGGRFAIRFKDSSEEHESRGEYKVVTPNQRLEFTWHWYTTPERESYVKIHLKPDGDNATLMTFTHEQFFDEAARDGHQRGWTGAFEKLDAFVAAL